MTTSLKSSKKNNLSGEVVIPGDKSISHRAILFGLLSKGKTQIHGSQNSEDVLNAVEVVRMFNKAFGHHFKNFTLPEEINLDNTETIVYNYIDSVVTDLDKERIKKEISTLMVEAENIEIE